MLSRATKGARNQAQEMINNLNIIQCALRHAVDPTMNADFAYFITNRLTNHRRIGVDRLVQTRHRSSTEDLYVRRLFPNSEIEFYQTVNIGRLRLCTRAYCNSKITDDSNILFRLNGSEKFGRIRSIITVDKGEPLLVVAYLPDVSPVTCTISGAENHRFPGIQISTRMDWSFVMIDVSDFVEKSVFYDSLDGRCFFFRFPTLTHCS